MISVMKFVAAFRVLNLKKNGNGCLRISVKNCKVIVI